MSEIRPIKPERIQRYVEGINKIIEVILGCNGDTNGVKLDILMKKYRMETNTMKYLCELGYLKRTSTGVYSVILKQAEPIHARRVIEKLNDYGAMSARRLEKRKKEKIKSIDKALDKAKEHALPKANPKVQESLEKIIIKKTIQSEAMKLGKEIAKKQTPKPVKPKRAFSFFWGLIKFSW